MRVAIVGCGRAGAQHAVAITAAGASVAAVCDEDPGAARELAATTGARPRPLAELLDDPSIDAVAVCTPPDSHVWVGLRALSSGKGAVIEKPLALDAAGVEQLSTAAARARRPLAVMLQHRGRLPSAALATPWSVGASAAVEVFRHRPAAHYVEGSWRGAPDRAGGGFFAHLALHYTDLACQLLGEPLEAHVITDRGAFPGIEVRIAACARMSNGGLLTLQASSLPMARAERLHVLDDGRSLLITNQETRYRDGEGETVLPAPPTDALRAHVYRELLSALRDGRPVERFGAESATPAIRLLERVGATAGQAMRLPV